MHQRQFAKLTSTTTAPLFNSREHPRESPLNSYDTGAIALLPQSNPARTNAQCSGSSTHSTHALPRPATASDVQRRNKPRRPLCPVCAKSLFRRRLDCIVSFSSSSPNRACAVEPTARKRAAATATDCDLRESRRARRGNLPHASRNANHRPKRWMTIPARQPQAMRPAGDKPRTELPTGLALSDNRTKAARRSALPPTEPQSRAMRQSGLSVSSMHSFTTQRFLARRGNMKANAVLSRAGRRRGLSQEPVPASA